jgi:hypothetical protein
LPSVSVKVAVTPAYAFAAKVADVGQLVVAPLRVKEHSCVPPLVNATVPVAPAGRPVSASVALAPKATVAELADPLTVMEEAVVAGLTVSDTVLVETEPLWLPSVSVKVAVMPEYAFAAKVADVVQLVVAPLRVNEHSCVPPLVNETVPVTPGGRPDSARVAVAPKTMVAELADPFTVTEKAVVAGPTVSDSVLVATELL